MWLQGLFEKPNIGLFEKPNIGLFEKPNIKVLGLLETPETMHCRTATGTWRLVLRFGE